MTSVERAPDTDGVPYVSVVMAVYNGGLYLRPAIESVLAQAFADFEFIIVDDASEDSSVDTIRSYRDPRIHLVESDLNVGLAGALNRGIARARGPLIARQDADDLSEPSRFDTQVRYLDQHPEVGVLGASTRWIDGAGVAIKVWPNGAGNPEVQSKLMHTCPLVHGSVMLRRRCLNELGAYDTAMRSGQDYDLWLRLSERWDIVSLPETLYCYRWHEQMTSIVRQDEQKRNAAAALGRAVERRLCYGKARLGLSSTPVPQWLEQAERGWLARRYLWWSQGARLIGRGLAMKFLMIAIALDPTARATWSYLGGIAGRKLHLVYRKERMPRHG